MQADTKGYHSGDVKMLLAWRRWHESRILLWEIGLGAIITTRTFQQITWGFCESLR